MGSRRGEAAGVVQGGWNGSEGGLVERVGW